MEYVGTGIVIWLGRGARNGVGYVPQLGKPYWKYFGFELQVLFCSWGVIVVDEGMVEGTVGGMFIFLVWVTSIVL